MNESETPFVAIGWTNRGNIRIESHKHTPMVEIGFFNTHPLTRLEKLHLLFELLQMMLNSPELTEEPIMEVNNGNKEGTEE